MPHARADTPDQAIYEQVAYRAMPDAPYKLDNRALEQMQKLERGLRYVLDNLLDLNMTAAEVAEHAGYSPSYFDIVFREHFEMPFERFVTRLRMRQAARDICDEHLPKGIAKRYGFANSASFSKAFKREIGVSPRQFYKGNYAVPDMPLRQEIGGIPIRLEYTIERAFALRGPTAPPPRGAETFLMDALALPYTGAYPQFDGVMQSYGANDAAGAKVAAAEAGSATVEGSGAIVYAGGTGSRSRCTGGDARREHVGIWYYRPGSGLEYVFGPVEERFDAISVLEVQTDEEDGLLRVIVQGGRYAVFSYPRPDDDRDIPSTQRALSRYVLQEWVPMNRKVTNTMGFTYERFTAERVYLYLPIKGAIQVSSELRELVWNVGEWARRIDELIDIDLTAEVLADLEGYSPKNYVDVFSMYYGITPSTYIRRRRLYLAGEELRAFALDADAGGRGQGEGSIALGNGAGERGEGERESETASGPPAFDDASARREEIVRKYRFVSYEQYLRTREKELGVDAGEGADAAASQNRDASGALPDLGAYYESNKERVAFEVHRLRSFHILGHSIEESRDGSRPNDLTSRVLYWFARTFPGFERFEPYFALGEPKVFIWANETDGTASADDADSLASSASSSLATPADGDAACTGPAVSAVDASESDAVSRYYVAYVLRQGLSPDERASLQADSTTAGAHAEVVPGGCYAVFSTVDDLESYSLEDAFSLLTRCAFGGWIKDNRWRVDFSRRTFVVWRDRKLYFHVPTIG